LKCKSGVIELKGGGETSKINGKCLCKKNKKNETKVARVFPYANGSDHVNVEFLNMIQRITKH